MTADGTAKGTGRCSVGCFDTGTVGGTDGDTCAGTAGGTGICGRQLLSNQTDIFGYDEQKAAAARVHMHASNRKDNSNVIVIVCTRSDMATMAAVSGMNA